MFAAPQSQLGVEPFKGKAHQEHTLIIKQRVGHKVLYLQNEQLLLSSWDAGAVYSIGSKGRTSFTGGTGVKFLHY